MRLILFFLLTIGAIYGGGSYYRVVNVASWDSLNVHKYPSARSKITAKLKPYDTGLIVSQKRWQGGSKWCDVRFLSDDYMEYERGVTREHNWVNCKFLRRANNIIYSDAIGGHHIFKVVHVAFDDVLNVRNNPYSKSKKIGYLRYNDINIDAKKCQYVNGGRWCYVAYGYYMGWAMGPNSTRVPYAKMGWVNMRFLKHDYSGKDGRLPAGMMFKGEVY